MVQPLELASSLLCCADATIPVEDAYQFGRQIRQHTLQIVDGADHCFTGPGHSEVLVKRVIDWVTNNM